MGSLDIIQNPELKMAYFIKPDKIWDVVELVH